MRKLLFALGFAVLLALDTLGQIGFKMVADAVAPVMLDLAFARRLVTEPWVLAVVAAYLGAFVTYMSLMKSAPIGPLFAASHLEIVTIAIVATVWFGETLSGVQIAGCLAILAGVGVLATAEEDAAQKDPLG